MSDAEIKKAQGADGQDYRVRLVQDEGPDLPFDDGSAPLWRVDYTSAGRRVEQVKMTSFDASDVDVQGAVEQFGNPTEGRVARWLKAYHGATVVETWHSGESWYIAADIAKWRSEMGVTVEQIREETQARSLMAEYQAWVQGDVYGYVIERRLVAYTTVINPADGEIIGTTREDQWSEVESLWGLYGHVYALRTAEEDFDAHMEAVAATEREKGYERKLRAEGR